MSIRQAKEDGRGADLERCLVLVSHAMKRQLALAKRYLKASAKKKSKGERRDVEKKLADLRRAVGQIIKHLEKSEK